MSISNELHAAGHAAPSTAIMTGAGKAAGLNTIHDD
jgi:hypothetical protein